jgi:hypothetical protein
MEEIKKAMMEDEEEDEEYLDRLRENSGSGLVNTRISDRETEVRINGLVAASIYSHQAPLL